MRIAIWVKTAVIGFFCAALMVAAATQLGGAEQGGPVTEQRIDPHAVFTAELAHRWPTCRATADFPAGRLPAFVLTQPFAEPAAPVRRMSFDRAWTLNQDRDPANDVWWIAKCRGDRP